MKKWRKFNVNEKVRVRLTDLGRRVLREEWDELRRVHPLVGKHTPPKEKDGWSEWQMWQLINHFGAHTGLGLDPAFETTIEIEI